MQTKIIPQKRFKSSKLIIKKQDTLTMFERDFRTSREVKGVSKATLKAYEDNFKRIYEFIGYLKGTNQREMDEPVSILDDKNFTGKYRNYLQTNRNFSIYSIQSSMRHYRAIMYFAMEMGHVRKATIHLKETDPPIKPTFTNYELEKLARKPNKDDFVEYRTWVMVHYLSSTANRVSSMLDLNVGDIDFENAAIVVSTQKNKIPRQKPLLAPMARILKEYIGFYRCEAEGQPLMDEPLFCSRFGNRLDYNSAYDAFDDYFIQRNVEFTGFHKFRHTYGANWIREGGNPFMLKEQLDHRTLSQTNRYANLYGMATRDEAEKFSLSRKLMPNEGRTAIKSIRLSVKSL